MKLKSSLMIDELARPDQGEEKLVYEAYLFYMDYISGDALVCNDMQ